MMTSAKFKMHALVFFVTMLFFLRGGAVFAGYPSFLVIDGQTFPGVFVNGTAGGYEQYQQKTKTLVLTGSQGGRVGYGSSGAAAYANLTGTWDGNNNILIANHTVVVPQVILASTDAYGNGLNMYGYDGITHTPYVGLGSFKAYTGIADGYIFNFGAGLPCYRYQTGSGQLIINPTLSWPPSNMYAFPSKLYVNHQTLQSTSFSEGLVSGSNRGYCCDQYYGSGNTFVDVHIFVSGTTGLMWGEVSGTANSSPFNATWNPSTQQFTADAGLGLGFAAPAEGSSTYGPPQIEWNGELLAFRYADTRGTEEVYADNTGSVRVVIDLNGNVTATKPYTTLTGMWDGNCFTGGDFGDPYSVDTDIDYTHIIGGINMAAVSADGFHIISDPGTLYTVYTQAGGDPGVLIPCGNVNYGWNASVSNRYSLQRPDGTVEYMYIPRAWCDGGWINYFNNNGYFIFSNIPGVFPWILGGSADATNGWSAICIEAMAPPNSICLNGTRYDYNPNAWSDSDNCTYFNCGYIDSNNNEVTLSGYLNPAGVNISLSGFGSTYSFPSLNSYSTDGQMYLSIPSPDISVPQQITWNGKLFSYVGHNIVQNTELYTYTSGTDWQVTITGSGAVTVTGSHTATGIYNAETHMFDFGNDTAMTGFYAQDSKGDLLGIGVGLMINVTNTNTIMPPPSGWMDGSARQVRLGDGTLLTATTGTVGYAYQRTANTVGAKYLGIAQGTLFQISDSSGNFTSPVYRYTAASGSNFVVNAKHNYADPNSYSWDSSSIFPVVIYVNGLYCSLSQYNYSNNGPSSLTNGNVSTSTISYSVPASTDPAGTVWVSFVFSNSGFLGRVSGTYAGSVINGSWDGNELFGNLPNGIIISTTPPPSAIRYGPTQILWNGTVLVFNAIGSSKTANNPTGGDLYVDPSGSSMSILIGSDGTVTYTSADGTQTTGTYSSATGQFTVRCQADGSILALDSAGNQTNRNGTGTMGSVGSITEMLGSLDIQGNFLALGSWLNASNQSVEGLSISYTDAKNQQPALLHFASVRESVTWVWSHAHSDGSTTQDITMQVDGGNRLQLYDPAAQSTGTTGTQPTIVLDPSATGTSQINGNILINGKILIQPQGDLEMGSYTNGPAPQE